MAIFPSSLKETKTKEKKPEEAPEEKTSGELEKKEVLEAEIAYRKGLISVIDLIAPSSFQVTPNFLRLNSLYIRTVFTVTYPRYVSVGWFAPIINFDAALDIAMYFYPVPAQIVLKQLVNKVGNLEAEVSADRERGMPRDPLKETALQDIERLRDDLTTGVEHFFQFALYVTIYAKNEKELDVATEQIENMFGSKLVYTRRGFYQTEQGFNSSLPLLNDELYITANLNSSPCASSFPFISADLTSDNGILYGINRHNNSLILFDRFSMPNANMCTFATSGAGKSIKADEPVLIKDKDGVRLEKIGQLIENLGKKYGYETLDEEMEGVIDPEISVYTFNQYLKGEWAKVTVAARKKAPKICYQFMTKSGRVINTTGDHNMLILRKGRVVTVKSDEVAEGEFVPLARKIPEPENPTQYLDLFFLLKDNPKIYLEGAGEFIEKNYQTLSAYGGSIEEGKRVKINPQFDRYLYKYRQERRIPIKYFWQILNYLKIEPDQELAEKIKICSCRNKKRKDNILPSKFKITPEFLRILGYIISEGTIGENFVLITNKDTEIKNDIKYCLKKLNICYYLRDGDCFALTSRVFVELIKVIGADGKSGEKKVPPFIFNLSNKDAAEFIKAYFEGDGTVEKHLISATSKSVNLVSDFSYLLLRYGIISRLAPRNKKATNGSASGIYWYLNISGQENILKFVQKINFVSDFKKKRLINLLDKKENTNVDVIPGIQEIFEEIYYLFSPQLYGIKEISDFKNGLRNPSRERLRKTIRKIEERIEYFKNLNKKFGLLKTLPSLSSIIENGRNDQKLNSILWQELGGSWRLMKNQKVSPRLKNVLKASEVINNQHVCSGELKQIIHFGFKELGLSMKHFNCSLATALVNRPDGNSGYQMIYEAASHIWRNYQKITSCLSQIEKRLIQLKFLANSDLFWDPITKIKKIENRDEYVYDLTVDNEVFLAGQAGLFVHNSYAIKLEVLRSLMVGTDVIIIDPEREYKYLSDAVGGTYINISLGSESKINPFDLPRPKGEGEVNVTDLIRSTVITLKGLLKIMIGIPDQQGVRRFTPTEDSLLDRALLECYAKKDIGPGCDLNKVEVPTLSDLQELLEGMEGGADLGERLKKYTEGTFSGLLNRPTNVEMNNQLVTFSVRDLEDELRPMAIYTIVNYIWNVVRSELKKRILVIDEAWWLMQHEDSAKFIFSLVKRCRKYYLGVTTITQDVNDFLLSPYGRAIVTNSALQLLMRQSPAAVENVAKTFMLTEGEKYLLLECGVGDGIFFAGDKHAAIKIVASYSEDQLITSDPRQILEIEKAKKEFAEKSAALEKPPSEEPPAMEIE